MVDTTKKVKDYMPMLKGEQVKIERETPENKYANYEDIWSGQAEDIPEQYHECWCRLWRNLETLQPIIEI